MKWRILFALVLLTNAAAWGQVITGGTVTPPYALTVGPPSPPLFSYSPSLVAFGNVVQGLNSSLTVTILNSGGTALTIGTITSSDAQFTISSDLCSGQTVPSGGPCTLQATFAPVATGLQSATFTVP